MRESIYRVMDYSEVSPAVQAIYDESKQLFGIPFVLNWIKCQGSNEDLLTGNWAKLKSTLIIGRVPNLLKQLIIYNVSAERKCDYCSQAHGIFANLLGKSMGDTPDFKITLNLNNEYLPASYRIAIDVITKAALFPAEITDEDMYKLADAGFSADEIKELMAQADLVNMLNTIADISGIKLDGELLEMVN